MKIFAAIVLVIGISLSQGDEVDQAFRAELDKHHQECLQVSKLDPQVLEKAKLGEIDENNTALKEHIFCTCEKYGMVKDNKIQTEAIRKFAEKQNRGHFFNEVFEKCNSVNDDVKVYLIKLAKCAYQHAPKGTIII
ncbi:hypothetical protein WA026_018220 [Henosepilachna vigintioctopunctata]|uniref:Uncharacterized protein n=1 Tax=Henosepilachna vigintioctopunctata TaxID=420089 RepID=A0AAW1VEH7_9CUCU